jgi:hypothetical protein
MKRAIFFLSVVLLFTMGLYAQQDSVSGIIPNEISFGLGAAKSFEKNIFNIPDDVEGGTNLGISIAYFRHLNEHWAVGVNLFGYMKTVDNVIILRGGSLENVNIDVSLINITGEAKYIFSRGTVEPYCLAFLAYSSGSLESEKLGRLNLSGVSGGAGAGLAVPLTKSFVISAEALASVGTAKWKEAPFLNSDGSDFNPSFIALFGQISYRF